MERFHPVRNAIMGRWYLSVNRWSKCQNRPAGGEAGGEAFNMIRLYGLAEVEVLDPG